MRPSFVAALTLLSLPLSVLAAAGPPARPIQSTTVTANDYPIFETDKIPVTEFAARRERVKKMLGPNGWAIFFTNPERNRSNDTDFPFRGNSNFLYLTGFEEPNSALILAPRGIVVNGKTVSEVLFCDEPNPASITWLGYRMGSQRAPDLLKIEAALPCAKFSEILEVGKKSPGAQLWTPELPDGPTDQLQKMISSYTASIGLAPTKAGIGNELAKLRVIKSPQELRLMRKAAVVSALAHIEALRSAKAGMREFEIKALVEYVFARNGCEAPAYGSIVGSGPNSCILHYEEDRRLMNKGDMVCMDVAGEFHGYAADVTRSYPIGGHYNSEQRAIYQLVLDAQNAGIKACRAGAPFRAAHTAASNVLLLGMKKLGLIKQDKELARYFMHGVSHYVGLDVHDAHGSATLAAGMVLTVEPGIYIREGAPCDKKWWNIGIRIEDDILVTDKDPEILSAGAPREIEDIERAMAGRGLGNLAIKPWHSN